MKMLHESKLDLSRRARARSGRGGHQALTRFLRVGGAKRTIVRPPEVETTSKVLNVAWARRTAEASSAGGGLC
jgi:hypothetical protein